MRVGFGVSVLARGAADGGLDGIGCYTRELMAHMPGQVRLLPFMFAPVAGHASGALPVDAGRFGLQALVATATGRSFHSTGRALRAGVDVVHATDHLIPKLKGLPLVATLFDAIPLAHPEWAAYRFRTLANELWRRTAHWAQQVITISEYSRVDIARRFRIPEQRITAIPLGVGDRWFAPVAAPLARQVGSRHRLPQRYFVAVGTLQPRKNFSRLLDAHAALPPALQREVPLVLVGKAGWCCDELVARLGATPPDRVRWLRHLPDEELQVVVKGASALVFPSLYEGFGLPILEAFAAGVPVVAADATSIPEVAGDAAVLVDPLDVHALAAAMQAVVSEPALARRCVERGLLRAREFTWQRTAERTLSVYRNL